MTPKIEYPVLILVIIAVLTQVSQTAVSATPLEITPPGMLVNALSQAPFREGSSPDVPYGIPHQQHNQNAPVPIQQALKQAVSNLPGIKFEPTPFSLSGSVGWRLEKQFANGPDAAFIRKSLEFAHQHVPADGSMHLLLPKSLAAIAIKKGWGVIHPWTDRISGDSSEYVMIFGPRDEGELNTIWILAQISYNQARGIDMGLLQ